MTINKQVLEFSLGENTFYIRRFPPFLALEILGDLQKQFAGPLISQLDGKESPKDAEGNIVLNSESANKMMQSFANLSSKLDGKTLRKLAETLIDPTYISISIDGADPRRFDTAAQGLADVSVADIVSICWEVMKHNYSEVIARLSSPTGPAGRLFQK